MVKKGEGRQKGKKVKILDDCNLDKNQIPTTEINKFFSIKSFITLFIKSHYIHASSCS